MSTLHYDTIVILDFGSQFSHLIVRRIRELGIYCELHPCLVKSSVLEAFGDRLKGVILSGGPFSVYEDGAPHLDASVWDFLVAADGRIPVLGICYGLQEISHVNGGRVAPGEKREFGHANLRKLPLSAEVLAAAMPKGDLLAGIPHKPSSSSADVDISKPSAGGEAGAEDWVVWMSHGDKIVEMAPGLTTIATSDNCEHAIVAGIIRGSIPVYGAQYHPEVTHSTYGLELLKNFCVGICHATANWSMASFVDEAVASIRRTVGPHDHVIGAVSGGVDSSVAAVLLNRAIGDRFHAILVDNGLLRLNEREQVLKMLKEQCGVNLRAVDASEQFLDALKGLTDPEAKRKAIGHTFIRVFEAEAHSVTATLPAGHKAEYLLQGTLYPDVIESISFRGPSATIKSHHNVGGLLDDMKLKLIEPLRELFKDEVRALGMAMGLPREVVYRHPFPGPGLGIRVLGEVTRQQCDLLRLADNIFISELRSNGLYDETAQAFVVLLPVKSVGVMGDARTYEQVCCIRAVASSDFMTASFARLPLDFLARVSTRIINEVRGINRVTYDITSKPPGTIEWE